MLKPEIFNIEPEIHIDHVKETLKNEQEKNDA